MPSKMQVSVCYINYYSYTLTGMGVQCTYINIHVCKVVQLI